MTPEERAMDIKRIRELQGIAQTLRAEELRISQEITKLSEGVGWNASAYESFAQTIRKNL